MKLYTAYDYGRGQEKAVPWQAAWEKAKTARKIRRIEVEGRPEEWYEWAGTEWRLGDGALRP